MLYILSFLLFWNFPVKQEMLQEPLVIEGLTMGTTYRILYFDEPQHRNFKNSVDSILVLVNKAINTYDPSSEISLFNRNEKGIAFQLPYFYEILKSSEKIYKNSGGAFDPTVMPLVNAWGFGPEKSPPPSRAKIDSLKLLIGFDKIDFNKRRVTKSDPRVQLDMGGIGQGYGADVLFRFLKSKGIRNMLVELGGEGLSYGENLQKNKLWRIGILDPNSTPENQFFKAYVILHNKAFTTSGNYFNYKIIDGRKLGHTIDPKGGYPVQNSLLSASVFAGDCTTADAWATAFMVMGIEKAIAKVKTLKGIDVLFIYSNENGGLETYFTPGISKQIILE